MTPAEEAKEGSVKDIVSGDDAKQGKSKAAAARDSETEEVDPERPQEDFPTEPTKVLPRPKTEEEKAHSSYICLYWKFWLVGVILIGILLGTLLRTKDSEEVEIEAEDTDSLDIRRYISSLGISLESDLMAENAPQFQALEWLETEDSFEYSKATMQAIEQKEFDTILVERYVLAVFYFSLSGEGWNEPLNFLSADHSCIWSQSVTTGGQDPIAMGVGECHSGGTVKSLRFVSNNLIGTIPEEIQYLQNLEALQIYFEPGVIGSLPAGTTKLQQLKTLEISNASLSGPLPDEIGDLVSLTSLVLSNNLFAGDLPSSFFHLTNLEILALDDNAFAAALNSFGALQALKYVYLENNLFYGALSERLLEVWEDSLVELDVSNNGLSAQRLPANMFGLPELEVVDLHGNNFIGAIPMVANSNSKLMFVSLADNQLSSAIPDSIGMLENLSHLDVSRNNLSGSLEMFCADNEQSAIVADCAEVTCPCCKQCCEDSDITCDGLDSELDHSRTVYKFFPN